LIFFPTALLLSASLRRTLHRSIRYSAFLNRFHIMGTDYEGSQYNNPSGKIEVNFYEFQYETSD